MSVQETTISVTRACAAADAAWPVWSGLARSKRGDVLRGIAHSLSLAGDDLLAVARDETGLSAERLAGELQRTVRQAEHFAAVVNEGSYLDLAIDHAQDGVPDVRRMNVALGPVAVFAAGNFPLAFGVFGNDTVSALAAGCTVVVKSHPDQPKTSEMTFEIIQRALVEQGCDAGVVSMVTDADAGVALIEDSRIRAGGFTGSRQGGRALFERASLRPEPIPFYAEMSSVNPVVVTRAAAATRGRELSSSFASAITGSAGQLCTKPGLIFVPRQSTDLTVTLAQLLDETPSQQMLSTPISTRFADAVSGWDGHSEFLVRGGIDAAGQVTPSLAVVDVAALTEAVTDEAFGPGAVVVYYDSLDQVEAALRELGGQLTTSLHSEPEEREDVAGLVKAMVAISGRILASGVPTGVRVSWAMTHGGPYPATTGGGATSIGAAAIHRWLRPVSWQDAPMWMLPDELRDESASMIPRRIDGVLHLE